MRKFRLRNEQRINNRDDHIQIWKNNMKPLYQKKIKLGVHGRRTKWAPIWAVLRKYGQGKAKRTHPSQITKIRRHWRRTKLKIKPRITRKQHLG